MEIFLLPVNRSHAEPSSRPRRGHEESGTEQGQRARLGNRGRDSGEHTNAAVGTWLRKSGGREAQDRSATDESDTEWARERPARSLNHAIGDRRSGETAVAVRH